MALHPVNTSKHSRSYCDSKLKQIKFCSGGNWCVEIGENICRITISKRHKKTPFTHKHRIEFCHSNLSMESTPEESVSLCVESENQLATQ